jgi:hypothetical protein
MSLGATGASFRAAGCGSAAATSGVGVGAAMRAGCTRNDIPQSRQ